MKQDMQHPSWRELDEIRRAGRESKWNTALDHQAQQKKLDKFLGCLIGCAAGDPLG